MSTIVETTVEFAKPIVIETTAISANNNLNDVSEPNWDF